MSEDLVCQVGQRRRSAGLSLTGLAARVGLSRQALTTIEAGRATPSTAVALRLARELGCPVEALFGLRAPGLRAVRAPGPAGPRVVVGRVGERWVAHGLHARDTAPADAMIDAEGLIEPLGDPAELERNVLVAGCAPVLGALAGHAGSREGRASWVHGSSGVSLDLLAAGLVHVAGMHLADRGSPETHDALVRAAMPGEDVLMISLVGWRQGLLLAPGDPLGIRSPADLARPGLRIARRSAGAGAAQVLERALAGLAPVAAAGAQVGSHLEAAQAVAYGAVDVAVAIEPMAAAFGLAFLPLTEERFELAVPARHLGHPGVARLLDRLASAAFAREVGGMGAYDLAEVGAARRLRAA